MKPLLLATFLLAIVLNSFAQTTRSADEAAIKTLIESETAAFGNRQYEMVLSYWANAPYVTHNLTLNGYDALKTALDGLAKNQNPLTSQYQSARNSDYKIRLNGSSAWVTFVQERSTPGGPARQNASRYLEKSPEGWKIVALVQNDIVPALTEAQLMTMRADYQQDPVAFLQNYAAHDFVFVGSEGKPYSPTKRRGCSNGASRPT